MLLMDHALLCHTGQLYTIIDDERAKNAAVAFLP